MFIKCRSHNMPIMINVNTIQAIIPMDDGATCSIRVDRVDGVKFFEWDLPFEQAQEFLIESAAQVTAPIAARLMGIDNTINRLARSAEDLLECIHGPGLVQLDASDPSVQQNIRATRRILDAITERTTAAPDSSFPNSSLMADVQAVINLLESNEWAEHCTKTPVGGKLEAEITRLIGHDNAATNKLQRAEQLLAEIYHAVNNDGGLYPIGPDSDLVARLSEYLYPDPVAALDRIGSQTARDILDE